MAHQQQRAPRTSRREFMLSAGLALAFPGLAGAKAAATTRGVDEDLELFYEQAAGRWVEALPVGNGRIGAMVFGRVGQERLQLNEDTLFGGGPYSPNNPGMADALPQVRELIAQQRYEEAARVFDARMLATPPRQMPYGTGGDLLIDFANASAPRDYRRSLELDSAVVTTRFRDRAATHVREVFASVPDQVLVMHARCSGAPVSFTVGYRPPRFATYDKASFNGPVTSAHPAGAAWNYREGEQRDARSSITIGPDGDAALLIEGRNFASEGVEGALRYAVRIRVVTDGTVTVSDSGIEVRDAGAVTMVIAMATSFINYADVTGDPVAIVRRHSNSAARKSYAILKSDHLAAHRSLFRRFALRLGSTALVTPVRRTTPQRIAAAETAPDPALAALYVQYGRYLLMASSRPGSQPANLQGLWNEGINPPWGSKFTININTEMNYWPAGPANLGECIEPLVRMVEDLAVTGAVTARSGYRARGWVTHHNTDLWRASAPVDGARFGVWPTGGAWLCMSLWDHYEYWPERAFLARIYPLLRGASEFFIDTLVEDAGGAGLVTSPSMSPENAHHNNVAICAGPAMDRQILRDLFAATLEAFSLLGEKDFAFAATLRETRARLPPDRVGTQGQLQEWLDDWDAHAPEQKHRHVSHLYAVYPSEQINVRDTPELLAAAKVSLNARGDMSTGWATAWRLCLWARMADGERAHAILLGLLGPMRTYPNMFDAHPPFQIDGNFGGTAGILEMLVQSWGGEIRLLPALPKVWPDGAVRGMRARGGIELDMEWQAGRLTMARFRGRAGQVVTVREGGRLSVVSLDRNGIARYR